MRLRRLALVLGVMEFAAALIVGRQALTTVAQSPVAAIVSGLSDVLAVLDTSRYEAPVVEARLRALLDR